MKSEIENEMKLEFISKSANEAFARITVAAFASQLDPTIEELADIKTAVSEAVTNCIIHGYERISASVSIEPFLRESRIRLGKDGSPQQIFVMLRRLNTMMCMLDNGPSMTFQPLYCNLVISLLTVCPPSISIFVSIEMYRLIDVIAIKVTEFVNERVYHGIIRIIRLNKEFIDVVINRLFRQHLRNEIKIPFLSYLHERSGRSPIASDFKRKIRVTVKIPT